MSSPTELSPRAKVTRVDRLTPAQEARFAEWRDKWISIGLRTGPAEREAFERHVRACYAFAGLAAPRVVWVSSPLVLSFAAPAASLSLEWRKLCASDQRVAQALLARQVPVYGAVDGAVRGAIDRAVDGAVGRAVYGAVGRAVYGAVYGAVDGAVGGAVYGAVDGAVRGAVGRAVYGAVGGAVDGAVGGADPIARAVLDAIGRSYGCRYSGQLWAGWPAWVSFFTDVCDLTLGKELDAKARAHIGTVESACWWWPHREFVMVCERPTAIRRDERGRLHNDTGLAIAWPDGWGVYAMHGVRVPEDLVLHPEQLTVDRIEAEPNAEVRREMIRIYGRDRYLRDAKFEVTHEDVEQPGNRPRRLLTKIVSRDLPPMRVVECLNATPEPDGTRKTYYLPVEASLRPLRRRADGAVEAFGKPQALTCHNAVASTFGRRGENYRPAIET